MFPSHRSTVKGVKSCGNIFGMQQQQQQQQAGGGQDDGKSESSSLSNRSLCGGTGGEAFSTVRSSIDATKQPPPPELRNLSNKFRMSINKQAMLAASSDDDTVNGLVQDGPARLEENKFESNLERFFDQARAKRASKSKRCYNLADVCHLTREVMEAVVDDGFTKCFQSKDPPAWNWNIYLWPMWLLGVVIRYGILFPFRLLCLLLGFLVFLVMYFFVRTFTKDPALRASRQRWLFSFLAGAFVFSWSGVIKYHGVRPRHTPNQVFCANHTSMIDIIVLLQMNSYAIVGQRHEGFVGYMQGLLSCLGCIWFNRSEISDRHMVTERIKEHVAKPDANPLLLFPEGTCVNNRYAVMFKKGAFELGATVIPVAIKYNKAFVDAFWNSRKQSFLEHLVHLMTRWAVVCDVYFLEPQHIQEGETAVQFAERVKVMICERANLVNVPWDGYLKYMRPNPRFLEAQQSHFAERLKRVLEEPPISVPPYPVPPFFAPELLLRRRRRSV
eukprot:gnl/Spiro4/14043_TR7534_c0_g1_i1.p1 gnl/Spiro4/14043_TR7534_c0_g1~~gnl/Spiro4/14043_TR7534_c0_g1_i1.p1  ORF type:complete len:517 (+),score=56.19 gnl/Spiro4/14043_TR7534_c0_g1_i1:52-1551(+)